MRSSWASWVRMRDEEQRVFSLALCNSVIARNPGSVQSCCHRRVFLRHHFPWSQSELRVVARRSFRARAGSSFFCVRLRASSARLRLWPAEQTSIALPFSQNLPARLSSFAVGMLRAFTSFRHDDILAIASSALNHAPKAWQHDEATHTRHERFSPF